MSRDRYNGVDGKSAVHYHVLFVAVSTRLSWTMGDWIHVSGILRMVDIQSNGRVLLMVHASLTLFEASLTLVEASSTLVEAS